MGLLQMHNKLLCQYKLALVSNCYQPHRQNDWYFKWIFRGIVFVARQNTLEPAQTFFFFIFQSTGIFVSALLSHKVCSHNLKKRSVLAYIDILKNLASNAPILRARVFFTCFYPISIHLDISHWLANACISFWSQRQPAAVIFKINILACVCVCGVWICEKSCLYTNTVFADGLMAVFTHIIPLATLHTSPANTHRHSHAASHQNHICKILFYAVKYTGAKAIQCSYGAYLCTK